MDDPTAMEPHRPEATRASVAANARRELVTMVFTDMVGSTQLKQELGDAVALRLIFQHHQLVRELLAGIAGARQISTAGDSFFLAFDAPSDAVRFALRLQVRLRELSRSAGHPIRDRVGIHAGEVFKHLEPDSDKLADLNGIQVDTCARVMSLAGPERILLTRFAFDNAQQTLKGVTIPGVASLAWSSHGLYELKGLGEPVEICEVAEAGRAPGESPEDTAKAHRLRDVAAEWIEPFPPMAPPRTLLRRLRSTDPADRRSAMAGALGCVLLGWILLFSGTLSVPSYDLNYVARLQATPEVYNDAVALVAMDDASMRTLRPKSLRDWDRRWHAQLIDRLREAGARAIVFDVVFEQPRSEEDPLFLDAIRRHGQVAVAVAQRKELQQAVYVTRTDAPFDALASNAWCGLVERADTSHLTIRRPRYGKPAESAVAQWPDMAQELAAKLGAPSSRRPLGAWLNYYCPPHLAPTYSYAGVLSNPVPERVFSNKVVFVGSKIDVKNPDEQGSDWFRTPYSRWGFPPMPGMTALATGYLNLARGDWLVELSPVWESLWVLLVGALAGYTLVFLPPFQAAIWGVLLSAGLAVGSIGACWWTGVWYPWLVPCLAQLPCAALWATLAHSRRLARERSTLREALRRRPRRLATTVSLPTPPATAVTALALPYEIPDHQAIRPIGEGAYGQVWLARDIIGTYHAVKILRRDAFSDAQPYEREFRGLQRFTPISREHPGLVQILHVGRNDPQGFLYYIMEAADDEDAGQRIDPERYRPRNLAGDLTRQGALPVREVIELGVSLAEALEFLHSRNLIHRDLKPANIIFVQGRPKLADVGLVTDMADGSGEVTFVGTVGYTAPEGPGTAAADVFSLGRLLYAACTGLPAQRFPGLPPSPPHPEDQEALLHLHAVLLKACEPAVPHRYPHANALLDELRRLRIGPR